MKLPRELVCYILKIKSYQAWNERKEFIQSLFCEYFIPIKRFNINQNQMWVGEIMTSYVHVRKLHTNFGSTLCWKYRNYGIKSVVSHTIY